MYKQKKTQNGITLIALVVSIIVLIILAGVSIAMLVGDNGIITQAQRAKEYQLNAESTESKLWNDMTNYIDNIIDGNGPPEDANQTATTVSEAKLNGLPYKNTTIIKDDLDNDVKIPGGFNIAEDSGTKIEEGIVIEDKKGNQFVWIPVGEYNVSTSINEGGKLINNLSRRTFTTTESREVSEDDAIGTYFFGEGNTNSVAKDQIEGFKTSANNNKGFYMGRYEAGTEAERTADGDVLTIPLVQANKNPYVYVTKNQAKMQAEAMYSENTYVTSELMSSYAWDTMLNFICQTNEKGYLLSRTTDSIYGNLETSSKKLTGTYLSDNYCNLYDIIGNCREWSTEYSTYNTGPDVDRGGYYEQDSGFAAIRGANTEGSSDSSTSFRIQMYVK